MFPLGTTTESWLITDYKGDTTEVSFNVNVTAPNAFPTLDVIAEVTADENAPEITVPVTGISYGNDCKPQAVTVTAEAENAELVDSVSVVYTDGDTAALVNITLVPDMSGMAVIKVIVTDSEGASMYRTFELTVNALDTTVIVLDTIVTPLQDTMVVKEGNLVTGVWMNDAGMDISMFPNPTYDQVTIEVKNYNARQTEVAVYTMTGAEVMRKSYTMGENIRFSMSEQQTGMYIVKMKFDGHEVIKKLVVDKK